MTKYSLKASTIFTTKKYCNHIEEFETRILQILNKGGLSKIGPNVAVTSVELIFY